MSDLGKKEDKSMPIMRRNASYGDTNNNPPKRSLRSLRASITDRAINGTDQILCVQCYQDRGIEVETRSVCNLTNYGYCHPRTGRNCWAICLYKEQEKNNYI